LPELDLLTFFRVVPVYNRISLNVSSYEYDTSHGPMTCW